MYYNWIVTYLDSLDGQIKVKKVHAALVDLGSQVNYLGISDMDVLSISKEIVGEVQMEYDNAGVSTST